MQKNYQLYCLPFFCLLQTVHRRTMIIFPPCPHFLKIISVCIVISLDCTKRSSINQGKITQQWCDFRAQNLNGQINLALYLENTKLIFRQVKILCADLQKAYKIKYESSLNYYLHAWHRLMCFFASKPNANECVKGYYVTHKKELYALTFFILPT